MASAELQRSDDLRLIRVAEKSTPDAILAAHASADREIAERLALDLPSAIKTRLEAQRNAIREARDRLLKEITANREPPASPHAALPARSPHAPERGSSGSRDPLLGVILSKRYEIIDLIGQGGMGSVYQAFDKLKQCYVAVKVIAPEIIEQRGVQDRFVAEAKLACSLSHPNIIRVHDVNVDDDRYYITMELLHGKTLRATIEEQQRARVPFPLNQGLQIAKDLLAALDYAHQYIVHRDIKPENIWICDDGTVKIMDFGLALSLQGAQKSRPLHSAASAYYLAPEQLLGATLDKRADQYGLAVVVYELLTGRVPTGTAKPLHVVRRDVPAGVSKSIMRALSSTPGERFASADEFLKQITRGEVGINRVDWTRLKFPLFAGGLLILGAAAYLLVSKIDFAKLHPIATQADRNAAISGQVSAGELFAQLDAAVKERGDRLRSVQADLSRLKDGIPSGKSADNGQSTARQLDELHQELDVAQAELDFVNTQLYAPASRTALMAKKAVADNALKENKPIDAVQQYAEVVDYLSPRAAVLPRVNELVSARAQAQTGRDRWLAIQNDASDTALASAAKQADEKWLTAENEIAAANFAAAIADYRETASQYEALLDGARARKQGEQLAKAQAARDVESQQQQRAAAQRQADEARLAEYYRDGREFRDKLASGGEGPLMVVRGSGPHPVNLRDFGNVASPTRGAVEAISAHNVSAEDFRKFVTATGYQSRLSRITPLYRDGATESETDAFTAADAKAYAMWLSQETGSNYMVGNTEVLSDAAIKFWLDRTM
jgi:tRNA A-37 threonylcarbamoyl transferase component Bud32